MAAGQLENGWFSIGREWSCLRLMLKMHMSAMAERTETVRRFEIDLAASTKSSQCFAGRRAPFT
ncbi:hypothetical protein FHS27_003098 [Rhodopirellula rubra]|uniref:Uncharacterized protein n=1 Tax=Aporhodopirellula rubra TaxID=980271 RepID=A0A7W5H5A9_9BACT|nr:hypothetical protein [Aporhodopirellula rubra]